MGKSRGGRRGKGDRLAGAVKKAAEMAARRADALEGQKVNVVLAAGQPLYLDRLALDIRASTGWAANRSAVLRALVGALMEAGLDVTGAGGETELRAILTDRLRK